MCSESNIIDDIDANLHLGQVYASHEYALKFIEDWSLKSLCPLVMVKCLKGLI